jgi:tRNA dimethylallyltransferase
VVRATGRSLLAWQATRTGGIAGTFEVRPAVVEVARGVLAERAAARLRAMVVAGALDEVAALAARQLSDDRPVMRALGVREFAAVAAGTLALETAITAATTATRQYQKRQATWARNQVPDWPRVDPAAPAAAMRAAGWTGQAGAPAPATESVGTVYNRKDVIGRSG